MSIRETVVPRGLHFYPQSLFHFDLKDLQTFLTSPTVPVKMDIYVFSEVFSPLQIFLLTHL